MIRRKIQLVAGSSYSVSLPKDWVLKNNLKEQKEIFINIKGNDTLELSPKSQEKDLKQISIDIEEYKKEIDIFILAAYYIGVEEIRIFSKNEISKDTKMLVRKTLTKLNGTEIFYEDKKKILIKVYLDGYKINFLQLLYRISLILKSQFEIITDNFDYDEIKMNENEVDRLYHLALKTISISLSDSKMLKKSNISHIIFIPSFFLISKKFENIGDAIYTLANHINNKSKVTDKKIINFLKDEMDRSIRHLMSERKGVFEKINNEKLKEMKKKIMEEKDIHIQRSLDQLLRYLKDIGEEITALSFYKKLMKDNVF